MRRIFITGGTGFFGKSILDYRLRHPDFLKGCDITILSRNPGTFIAQNSYLVQQLGLQFCEGDVRSFTGESLGDFDALIHAATPAVTTLPDEEMTSTIIGGTQRVLEFAHSHHVKKLLFTSSGAVYGPQSAPVDETIPCRPTTAYGEGKLRAEQMCIGSGIPTTIARCFAFIGPFLNRRIHFAIGNFIQNCLDGEPIIIKGDGTPIRSYLFADDLVEWLFAILERGSANRAYNVGAAEAFSIRAIAEQVRTTLGSQVPIRVLGVSKASSPSVYVPRIDRIQNELSLQAKTPLHEAILKSVFDR